MTLKTPLMEWSSKFATRIPSIDRQHKVIIGFINDLHAGMEEGEVRGVVGHTLQGLINYTRVHFAYEAMLFKVHGFADQEEHLAVHERMVEKIGDFKQRFDKGEADISEELLDFLKNWLFHHILEDDMAYAEQLRDKGVA